MKMSLLGLVMLTSLSAQAAGITCNYQAQSCNQAGDHYRCEYYGWGQGEFCSPTDVSRRINGGRVQENSCDDCYSQPRPSKFCREQCGCHSSFCGQW
jgi:hypothetical protein